MPAPSTGRGDWVHPSVDDPVVAALSDGVGGPVGPRAGRHPWWTPIRVLLALTAVCMALGMFQKNNCYQDTWGDSQARYTHMCYSDLPYLYTGRGFAELNWPYTDNAEVRGRYEVMEYPVGISYWAWGTAWVTHWLNGSPDIEPRYQQSAGEVSASADVQREKRIFVIVNALGFAAHGAARGLAARRGESAPPLGRGGLRAVARAAPHGAGQLGHAGGGDWSPPRCGPGPENARCSPACMIGLGMAVKLYPLFLLGGVLVICLRQKRIRDFLLATLGAAVAWILANLPAYLSGPDQWKVFWTFNSERGADLGSIWLVAQQALDRTDHLFAFDPHTINLGSWLFFGAWCAGVLVLGLTSPSTPRLAQLGFLLVAGFLLVNKVYSPQYVLWLLPLAVLARPRWRDLLIWQAGEIVYFAAVWWYLGGFLAPASGGDAGFYWAATLIRIAAELYLVAIVVRDIWYPRHDPVRATASRADDDEVERRRGVAHPDVRWSSLSRPPQPTRCLD